jgi:hypothetical protein
MVGWQLPCHDAGSLEEQACLFSFSCCSFGNVRVKKVD